MFSPFSPVSLVSPHEFSSRELSMFRFVSRIHANVCQ